MLLCTCLIDTSDILALLCCFIKNSTVKFKWVKAWNVVVHGYFLFYSCIYFNFFSTFCANPVLLIPVFLFLLLSMFACPWFWLFLFFWFCFFLLFYIFSFFWLSVLIMYFLRPSLFSVMCFCAVFFFFCCGLLAIRTFSASLLMFNFLFLWIYLNLFFFLVNLFLWSHLNSQ